MSVQTIHGIALDICPECGGIWFQTGVLKTILSEPPQVLSQLEHLNEKQVVHDNQGPSRLFCPDCRVLLEQYHYMYNSPLLIHACTHCGGLFVSAGELSQMRQWRELSHQPVSPKEQAAALLAEATAEHEMEMYRQRNLADFFKVLRIHEPGWFGF
jgi:Zn-finger nucleic acid-binding protein